MLRLHKVTLSGVTLELCDQWRSRAAEFIVRDFQGDCYGLKGIPFEAGDRVIDVGAHVGAFAMLIAKLHPDVHVLAYEPFPENFKCLEYNLHVNHVKNVTPYKVAITGDGRSLTMATNPWNSGGATSNAKSLTASYAEGIPSVTLDQVFDAHKIRRCKLLKVDCEGSEYEILLNTRVLSQVDYLSVEVHTNKNLRARGCTYEGLTEHCSHLLGRERTHFRLGNMSE